MNYTRCHIGGPFQHFKIHQNHKKTLTNDSKTFANGKNISDIFDKEMSNGKKSNWPDLRILIVTSQS